MISPTTPLTELLDIFSCLNQEEKQEVLNRALKSNKVKIVFQILDKGFELKLNNTHLHDLVRTKNCVPMLEGLQARGMDLSWGRGLIFKAIMSNQPKMDNIEYLYGLIDTPDHAGLVFLVTNLSHDLARTLTYTKKEEVKECILQLILPNLSEHEQLKAQNKLLESKLPHSVEVNQKMLAWKLERTLPAQFESAQKMKI